MIVAIAIAYDTFFKNNTTTLNNGNLKAVEQNQLYETIINLSVNHTITYGLFSIILAIGFGVLASVIRRSISNYRKRSLLKAAK